VDECRPSYNSDDVSASTIRLHLWAEECWAWPVQASHIFGRLGITSDFEDYVVVNTLYFEFVISATTTALKGFLFLCPAKDFQTGPASFAWPECPAYWSLDPLGVERLSTKDVTDLGFPSIRLSMRIEGISWDTSIYAGIRQFHEDKGFDPDTQDVARYLGHPLYQLSAELNVPFAHMDDAEDDQGLGATDQDSDNTPQTSDEVLIHVVERDPKHSSAVEELPLSQTFKSLMNIQVMLILFLTLSGLYDQGYFIKWSMIIG